MQTYDRKLLMNETLSKHVVIHINSATK